MTTGTQDVQHDGDMPCEIDFSKVVRARFFKPGTRLDVPVYL